jgi:hypothetical protein
MSCSYTELISQKNEAAVHTNSNACIRARALNTKRGIKIDYIIA